MLRRARWIVVVLVLVVAAAALAGALLVRPDLADARDRVDARWATLRAPLSARYAALSGVVDALDAAGAGSRPVTREMRRELGRWSAFTGRDKERDPALEVASANALEALARRMKANVAASARLNTNEVLKTAIGAFDLAIVPEPPRVAYNRSVRAYEATRDDAFEQLVAGILGFDARPQLLTAPGA